MPRRSKRTTAVPSRLVTSKEGKTGKRSSIRPKRVKKGGGPYLIDGQEHWEVEKVLNTRKVRGRKKVEYYVKWKGYPTEENSWVTGEDTRYMQDLIEDFYATSSDEK